METRGIGYDFPLADYQQHIGYLPMLFEKDRSTLENAKKLNIEPKYDPTVDYFCDVYELENGRVVQFFTDEYINLREG